ncbi:hypothetical protein Q4S45_14740 [Massilia sp. R2A-15]|uniref:hypothetical protein n=1 Tax=Massilia sp. R2A-15 TaxID=3064278 RepID=UPI002735019B|nr:hypothetical protein [Massilia sp. R2A-15]WLI87994.1 hypothetical protein Q4S45_14740 [Massilia sp. R2A-15]
MAQDKRKAPPVVEAVGPDGTRYSEVQFEKSDGQVDQNSGYIAAVDGASGQRKWVLKVYDVCYSSDLEADVQDIFIKQLSLSGDGKTLFITNEDGHRYAVDLERRTVIESK